MTTLVEVLLTGLSLGSVYALIAVGFVVIFRACGVMNFAHGSLLLFGGYLTAVLHEPLGFLAALAAAVLAAAALAGLIELLLMRRRPTETHVLAIVTIGVDILLLTELARRIGPDVLDLGDPWGAGVVSAGGVTVAQSRVASVVVAAALVSLLFAAFRWSRWGLAMRAAAADREAASLMGLRLGRVRLIAWCVAGALAAVAAVFLAAFPTPGLDRATGEIALRAFPAAVLGGMDSVPGALVGSVLIGVTQAAAAGYQRSLGTLGEGLSDVAPYLVMIIVLLIRPRGLFGTREAVRV
ncbi:branched-chain amino acid transport system permease protein [Actinoalloteichus hoggarensis]|uniref:High-affinity branched-chain amino acid transport system permease protein LivH n=1 Tax=Actinoalloteichus hoggarensis TaxID=1470176 RepID=A0A221W2Y3_9PSEU|nr:branched-chain amino acid ABC transporter permease [Actinoalloteichus hoggarensis]ASO20190.1 High-affinity branched-chain amino acid transport system permease protein LivH [Actinoalloteichus hoggarensis]MBB5919097.1 branched-chain amino acid transport system permease protein [Actinoalloteichus hoggarensis]